MAAPTSQRMIGTPAATDARCAVAPLRTGQSSVARSPARERSRTHPGRSPPSRRRWASSPCRCPARACAAACPMRPGSGSYGQATAQTDCRTDDDMATRRCSRPGAFVVRAIRVPHAPVAVLSGRAGGAVPTRMRADRWRLDELHAVLLPVFMAMASRPGNPWPRTTAPGDWQRRPARPTARTGHLPPATAPRPSITGKPCGRGQAPGRAFAFTPPCA